MTSTNLNNAQQAAALHLFQTLCAYPESNLSQKFQQLAQLLPTNGQATLDRLAPLAAFFKKQGIEMGEFADVAESLLESPAAWAGFADRCVYTLMTGDAGSDIPSLPGGQVVFDRASASPSTDNDGYAIAYSAPDGSSTPLHYTNGQLVSNPEQANPAINLCTTYAPSSSAPAVQPVLYGSVNGQQAIGLNLDETGSDDQSIWKKSGQFIKDHWKGISIGSGGTVVVVVIIVLVVKYIRRANAAGEQVQPPQNDVNQFLDPQGEGPQGENPVVEQIQEVIHNNPEIINDLQQVHHEDPQIPNNLPEINQDPMKQKIIHLSDVVKKKGVDYLGRKEVLNQNDKYWILENIGGDEYVNAFKEQYKDQILQKRIFEDLADKIGSQAMEIYSTSRNMTNIQMQSTMDVDRLRELDPFNEQENHEFVTQMKDVVYPNQRKILSLQKDLTAEYKEAKSAGHLKQQQAIQDALNKIPTLDPHDSDNVNGQIQDIKNGKVDRQNLDKKPPVQQQKSPDNLAQPQPQPKSTEVPLQQEFDQWAKQIQLQRDKFAKFEEQFNQWKSQANSIQNPTDIPEKFKLLSPEDIQQAVKNLSLLDDNALDASSNPYRFENKELDWLEDHIGDKLTIKEFATEFDSMIKVQQELNTLTQMLQAELRESLKDDRLNLSTIRQDFMNLDSLDTLENTEREAVIQQIMDNMRTRQEVDLKQSDESLKKTFEPSDAQHSVPVWKTISPEDLINHVKDYAYYTDPNNNRRDHIRKYFKDIKNKSEEHEILRKAIDKPFNIQKDINQMINNFEAIKNGDYLGENTKTIIKSEKEILKHINPFNPTTEDVIIDLYDRHIEHWKAGTKNDHIFNDKDFQAFDQSMQQRKAAKNEQHGQFEKVQQMKTAVEENASQFAQQTEYDLAQKQEQQLLTQNQKIKQLQEVSNTPDARRLMQQNLQAQQNLTTDNFQNPLSGANQLIQEEQQILQTNQQVNINEKQQGLPIDKTTQHIKDQQQQPIKDQEEKGKKKSEEAKEHEVLHFEE